MKPTSIQDHGLIGNMRSAALVAKSGAIDFFCFPEFDSPSVFASLLDEKIGGSFALRPKGEEFSVKQLYVPETNLLLTRFLAEDGIAELCDFMPVTNDPNCHGLIRQLTIVHGTMSFKLRCSPSFDYARCSHVAQTSEDGVLFTPASGTCPPMLLRGTVPLIIEDEAASADFTLSRSEKASFIFGLPAGVKTGEDTGDVVQRELEATGAFWRGWAAKSVYKGRWREMVTRSALAMKLLTSDRYGSLIAAPTFGLPEVLGGSRNWDYRYTWLRDASFTLYAISRLGYVEEGGRFMGWLKVRLRWDCGQGPLQVMYGMDGRTELPESTLDHLAGYRDSKPVRIGNAAFNQLQLDIYGELFDAIYLSSKFGDALPYEGWENMKRVLRWLAEHWSDPDEGIWEVRGGRKQFLHSRLMCWVAFDRAIRLGNKRSLAGPFGWMEDCRDAIVRDIHENFWDTELGAFVQFKGAHEVDAATLLMPLLRFISPVDPRWLSTLAVIERDLTVDTLVRRYRTESNVDGLTGREGSFTACSFWFVEALARSHQLEKAHLLFAKLMSYANDLGLYSEELSAIGEHLGNFPQALTHLAFISAATYLDRRLSKQERDPWS
jgi:GH15 family glucan-1,4-alpha-glucosidase